MKTEFTKGEWKIRNLVPMSNHRIEIKDRNLLAVGINPESDNTFEAVAIVGLKTNHEVKANAKLIAAAPDLLNACIEAETHHQGGHSELGDLLRNAIRKALK
jgi:hypothetical protein